MARDKNAEERIESTLYGFASDKSGLIAQTIYDAEIKPLIEHLENMIKPQMGIPINAIEFGQQVKAAQDYLENAKKVKASDPKVPTFEHVGHVPGCYLLTCWRCKNQHEADRDAKLCEDCAKKELRERYPHADYTEADVSHVDVSYEGKESWVLEDGRIVPVPEGWSNDIPGVRGFTATKISDDGKTEIKDN